MRGMPDAREDSAPRATLVRTLNLRDLIFLVVGSVIGSGIFLVPGPILRDVGGSVLLSLCVWIGGGVLSLLGALTYGELAARDPSSGGLYVYVREAFGSLPAFLYGWALFLAVASGSNATLSVAFSKYLGEIVALTPLEGKIVAVVMIAAVTWVNVIGTRKSADLQNWTTFVKIAAILTMSVALFTLGHGDSATAVIASAAPQPNGSLAAGFGLAMIAVLWAYEGWAFATYTAGETLEPQRNFPRGLAIGALALIAIYTLADVAYLHALGPARAAQTDTIAAVAVAAVLGSKAGKLVALMILVSVFSAANSTVLTAPRVFHAMAEDGVFFPTLARVHPRYRTPAAAIVAIGVWSAVLAVTGTFEQLFTYVIFVGWTFYGLAAMSIFVFRRREGPPANTFRVPGYPVTPLLFVLAAAALVGNTLMATPWKQSLFGVGIVLLGVPVYFFYRWRKMRAKRG